MRCKKNTPVFIIIAFIVIFFTIPLILQTKINAEQSGETPESGVTSKIKQIYDSLVSLTYGSDSAGAWGDWGSYWNRIRSAAEWTPGGDATESDVISGKTFYGGSRAERTGTWTFSGDAATSDVVSGKTFYNNSSTQLVGTLTIVDYSTQSPIDFDDAKYGDSTGAGDTGTEEATWTNTSTNVWQDTRTNLYWSNYRGNYTNSFNSDHSTCPFFGLVDKGSYDGLDSDCGNAINACGTLSLDSDGDATPETDWYLPSQKEYQQAYLDGMLNQTGATFTESRNFWSATEVSDAAANAWYTKVDRGRTWGAVKTNAYSARCIRL